MSTHDGAGSTGPDALGFTSVDQFLPPEWPPDVSDALARWTQGDAVRGPGLLWAGPRGADRVTGAAAGTADWEPFYAPGLIAPYGVVCSQTCDIGAGGPGRRHPFVEVCPAYDASNLSPNAQQAVRDYDVVHLVPLSSPPQDGFWVADLRLLMPVSKALLATQTPVDVFASEQDRLVFAEALAAKHRRPALQDVLSEDLPRDIDTYINDNRKQLTDVLAHVDHVRLAITGERLRPSAAQLFVVEQTVLDAALRDVWRRWDARGTRLLRSHGIDLLPTQFQTLDAMSARTYRQTLPLRLTRLRRTPVW